MLTKVRNVRAEGTADEKIVFLVMDGDEVVMACENETAADELIALSSGSNVSREGNGLVQARASFKPDDRERRVES